MDMFHNREERKDVVRKFLQKMVNSGYDKQIREKVIKSAVRKHHRDMNIARKEGRSIHL